MELIVRRRAADHAFESVGEIDFGIDAIQLGGLYRPSNYAD